MSSEIITDTTLGTGSLSYINCARSCSHPSNIDYFGRLELNHLLNFNELASLPQSMGSASTLTNEVCLPATKRVEGEHNHERALPPCHKRGGQTRSPTSFAFPPQSAGRASTIVNEICLPVANLREGEHARRRALPPWHQCWCLETLHTSRKCRVRDVQSLTCDHQYESASV